MLRMMGLRTDHDNAGMPHTRALLTGTLFALAAGLMWGLVFVAPLLLPQYPAVLLSFARYLAFGLIALPLAYFDRTRIRELTSADWWEALKLSAVGNLLYYLCLASAIQRAGGPLPTMVIGTLPVVIALVSNRRDAARDGRLPWLRMTPSLLLLAAGIACVNHSELQALRKGPQADTAQYLLGAVLAVGALLCWTWYPIRNADWLRHHADRSPSTWATAQGLVTLPMAALGFAGFWLFSAMQGPTGFVWLSGSILGPTPQRFVLLMVAIGLFASWLGTLCWNEASQRLPTSLVGQLIVFETLSALAYAFWLRGRLPEPLTTLGVVFLVAGVMWALRTRPLPTSAGVTQA
jgi:drug/metabolite transporter (DMT)-like permease